jgi:hypothetical protein
VGKEALVKSMDQELVSRSTSKAFCFLSGPFSPWPLPNAAVGHLGPRPRQLRSFNLEPHPVADLDPAAIAAHQDSDARFWIASKSIPEMAGIH